jgi:hypothetical protein
MVLPCTAYSATASQAPSGQDVVKIVVTLPTCLVGKNVPIYVVSNGHGNALFAGAPEGGNNNNPVIMDAPTGNTVQVPIISDPMAITAMCSPPANPCAAGATAPFRSRPQRCHLRSMERILATAC